MMIFFSQDIDICLELDDQGQLQNPREDLGRDLCSSFPDRFFEVSTPNHVADTLTGARITLMSMNSVSNMNRGISDMRPFSW